MQYMNGSFCSHLVPTRYPAGIQIPQTEGEANSSAHRNVQCEMCGKSLTVQIASVHEGNKLYKSHRYLTNVQCSYRQFGRETICTSHAKVYFNEFVANAFHDNMGIVNFDL